ncbi:MAG: FAD-dependent oxidoreductase, partial [Thermomicrobiales bacterium]|nr:FAD-dependent oxidoreductase [Thermomicrobiales bacterium]
RRFLGGYFMTEADILRGINTVPDDEVAFGGWPIDLHAPDGVYSRDEPCTQPPLPDVYGIPLGSLYSNTVANLFYAGRNISQSHVAHGSTRVMKTTSVVGEAAGVAAHIALSHDLTPRAAASDTITEIQQQLLRQGAYLPRLRNTDANDLVQTEGVRFGATSESSLELGLTTGSGAAAWDQAGLSLAESQIFGDADHNATRAMGFEVPLAQSIVVSSGRIDRLKLGLRNRSGQAASVQVILRQGVHLRDCGPMNAGEGELYTATLIVPSGESLDWIRFDPPIVCQPDAPIVIVAASAGPAEWMLTPHEPPGTQAAKWDTELGYWRWLHGTFEIALDPLSTPFGPEQIASGVTRPETATNMWISDPAQTLPQSLTITWPAPVEVDCLHLTFDSQLSGWIWEGAFPMIAKRYNVEGQTGDGTWSTLVEVTDNVLRRRVHSFAPVTISALRVTILGTHGGATARLVEVRAHGREGR